MEKSLLAFSTAGCADDADCISVIPSEVACRAVALFEGWEESLDSALDFSLPRNACVIVARQLLSLALRVRAPCV